MRKQVIAFISVKQFLKNPELTIDRCVDILPTYDYQVKVRNWIDEVNCSKYKINGFSIQKLDGSLFCKTSYTVTTKTNVETNVFMSSIDLNKDVAWLAVETYLAKDIDSKVIQTKITD